MNKIKYTIKFKHAADCFGIRNAYIAEREENSIITKITKTERYVQPWRFICESTYDLLQNEQDTSNIVIQLDDHVINLLTQYWSYFEFDRLKAKKNLDLEFKLFYYFNSVNIEDVFGNIEDIKNQKDYVEKTEINFFVVNRQRYDLSHKPCGAVVLIKYSSNEKISSVIKNQGKSTEVIRQAILEAVRCLKKPCHINIYAEPSFGLTVGYFGSLDDSLDELYQSIRFGRHSFEIIHFTKHENYIDLKERVSFLLRKEMEKIEKGV